MFSHKLMFSAIHVSSLGSLQVQPTSWATQSSLRNRGLRCRPFLGTSQGSASREMAHSRRLIVRHEGFINHPQNASAAENGSTTWTGEIGEVAKAVQRKTNLQVVLVSPQIPGNTGCIARSCAAAAVGLHLVEPMGFEINSAKLKRAGLDYWPSSCVGDFMIILRLPETRYVVVKVHKSWADFSKYFQQLEGQKRLLAFTKTGNIAHTAVKYNEGDFLLFGSETDGLPAAAVEECLDTKHGGGLVRIPIDETYVRCLNLSVAAGIGIYEALRQLGCTDSMMQRPLRDSAPMEREDIFC